MFEEGSDIKTLFISKVRRRPCAIPSIATLKKLIFDGRRKHQTREARRLFIQLLSADFYYLMLAKIDTQCSENFLHQNKWSDDTEQWCAENYPLAKKFAPPTTSVALFGQIEQNCHIKHLANSYSDVVYCEDRRLKKGGIIFPLKKKTQIFSRRRKHNSREVKISFFTPCKFFSLWERAKKEKAQQWVLFGAHLFVKRRTHSTQKY